jgi:hypothetical protein
MLGPAIMARNKKHPDIFQKLRQLMFNANLKMWSKISACERQSSKDTGEMTVGAHPLPP